MLVFDENAIKRITFLDAPLLVIHDTFAVGLNCFFQLQLRSGIVNFFSNFGVSVWGGIYVVKLKKAREGRYLGWGRIFSQILLKDCQDGFHLNQLMRILIERYVITHPYLFDHFIKMTFNIFAAYNPSSKSSCNYIIMSEIVLQKSKILCYFTIDSSFAPIKDQLLEPLTLPLTIYHFHYPPAYYSILYCHFKNYFPINVTQHHLCIKKNGKQLPPQLPLGLELDNNDTVEVSYRQSPVPEGFQLIMTSWKKGYTIVNREGGCDHVFKKLSDLQKRQLYHLHLAGHSHGLHKASKYEGNCIALKIYCEGNIIERKEDNLDQTIFEYFQKTLSGVFNLENGVMTHGVKVDTSIKLKQLLDRWNYNDGYCYLKVSQ